jgi:hypothetical protein
VQCTCAAGVTGVELTPGTAEICGSWFRVRGFRVKGLKAYDSGYGVWGLWRGYRVMIWGFELAFLRVDGFRLRFWV